MEKQKAQLKQLFEELGFTKEEAAEKVSAMFPEDNSDPELDKSEVILKAQEHFKPVMKQLLKKELSSEFKGQYMGEAINKIVAASKGKLKRSDFEDGNVEKALSEFAAVLEAKSVAPDEVTEKYNKAIERIAELELEKEEAVNSVRNEYSEKENNRLVYDTVLAKLGAMQNPGEGKVAKKLTVAQDHAAKSLLREFGDEYVLKYDESKKAIGIFNKANPGEIALHEGKVLDIDTLLTRSLTNNNWIAQSNGGSKNPNIVDVKTFSRQPAGDSDKPKSPFRQQLETQVGDGTNG